MSFPLATLKTLNALGQINYHWTALTGWEFMRFHISKRMVPNCSRRLTLYLQALIFCPYSGNNRFRFFQKSMKNAVIVVAHTDLSRHSLSCCILTMHVMCWVTSAGRDYGAVLGLTNAPGSTKALLHLSRWSQMGKEATHCMVPP